MGNVDYFALIHAYIDPGSLLYRYYLPHVAAVTMKALRLARHLGLDAEQRRFIEEAAMLHDIGVVRVHAPGIGCYGELPYIAHLVEGQRILEGEGLPRHASVAAHHVGVGITKEEVVAQGLPLPPYDFVPQTLAEEIISWADLFFSKTPGEYWREQSGGEVQEKATWYGARALQTLEVWRARFDTF